MRATMGQASPLRALRQCPIALAAIAAGPFRALPLKRRSGYDVDPARFSIPDHVCRRLLPTDRRRGSVLTPHASLMQDVPCFPLTGPFGAFSSQKVPRGCWTERIARAMRTYLFEIKPYSHLAYALSIRRRIPFAGSVCYEHTRGAVLANSKSTGKVGLNRRAPRFNMSVMQSCGSRHE